MKLEWKTCFKIGVSIFLLYLCIHYWASFAGLVVTILSAATPLIIGSIIAYLINILMSFYERHYFSKSNSSAISKSRRPVCMVGAFLTAITIVLLIIGLIVPQLISCIQLIISTLPGAMEDLIQNMDKLSFIPENIVDSLDSVNWKARLEQLVPVLTSGLGGIMGTVVQTVSVVFSGTVTALLSVIFSIYLLSGKDRLHKQSVRLFKHYLRPVWYQKIAYTLSILNDCMHRYIVGQFTEAVILGMLCTSGMLILRLPYATMIGALVAFMALIPVAGAYIGAGVGAFMILTVSPTKALVFLIFIVILQQLEGNLIYPRVVGSSIGLPGIWVLAAVTIGGGIFGITGMLLGVPVTATVYRMIRTDMNKSTVGKSSKKPVSDTDKKQNLSQ